MICSEFDLARKASRNVSLRHKIKRGTKRRLLVVFDRDWNGLNGTVGSNHDIKDSLSLLVVLSVLIGSFLTDLLELPSGQFQFQKFIIWIGHEK